MRRNCFHYVDSIHKTVSRTFFWLFLELMASELCGLKIVKIVCIAGVCLSLAIVTVSVVSFIKFEVSCDSHLQMFTGVV